jgi:hypothetical protein
MPSLSDLKEKWFIDVEDPHPFPAQQRHPGSHINPSTDGNQVELLVEGAAVMGDFHYRVQEMLASDDPREETAAFHQNAVTAKGRLRLAPRTRMRPEFPRHKLPKFS